MVDVRGMFTDFESFMDSEYKHIGGGLRCPFAGFGQCEGLGMKTGDVYRFPAFLISNRSNTKRNRHPGINGTKCK